MNKLHWIILTAVLLVFCGSCVNLKPPVTTFRKYEVKKVNLTSAEFNFIFDTENPNDIPLDVKSIEYRFYIEGHEFMNGRSDGFNLNAKDKKEIRIPINIKYLGMLNSVAEAAKALISGNKKIKYKLEGDLVIESLGASARTPLAAQGELTLIN